MTALAVHFALSDVSLHFGDTVALEHIDLEIRAGEAVALVGPSGAGKTSLLHLLCGRRRPTRGRVHVGGRLLEDMSRAELKEMRASIGFVHQNLSLVPNLRVSQNVLAGRVGRQSLAASTRSMLLAKKEAVSAVHAILERVGIEEKLFERTDRLSGGQQQRVAIARALYQSPEALMADEPVSSVDPARARDTVELLTRISREERLTLCVSLHSLELARACFPRLIGLRGGRIIFDSASQTIADEQLSALYALDSPLHLPDPRPAEPRADGS